eukprot:TRINITY_DN21_c0_g1_i13.p1 TRINITY_DN21_c0_g1~~TRINITY_DN21_c0_g1_i13.p1  ORF type:complete len:194 (-),score=37.72 TRINITY_DN21_c0_g1_i13:60-641(-)
MCISASATVHDNFTRAMLFEANKDKYCLLVGTKEHTIKLILAAQFNILRVDVAWVIQCLKQGELLPVDEYVLPREKFNSELFLGLRIELSTRILGVPSLKVSLDQKECIKALLIAWGARVVSDRLSIPELAQPDVVVNLAAVTGAGSGGVGDGKLRRHVGVGRIGGVVQVLLSWVLKSALAGLKLPYEEFLLQ